jgi:hypothetical protein
VGILGEYTFWMSSYFLFVSFCCCANLIVYFVQELYRFIEGVFEDDNSLVFNKSARKDSKDSTKHIRYQLITYYYRRKLKHSMNTKIAKDFHLEKEQYLLGKIDWLVKDAKA